MKTILSCVLFFAIASVAQAGPLSQEEPDHFPYDPYPVPAAPFPLYGSSYAFCRAETICPNGMPIGCYAYGNAATYTACTWNVVPGRYVECHGFNDLGIWGTAWARCF